MLVVRLSSMLCDEGRVGIDDDEGSVEFPGRELGVKLRLGLVDEMLLVV